MPRVLITKNITPRQLRLIMDAELEFEIETAIEFKINFNTNEVIQSIKSDSEWIFTSINAVKSIQPLLIKYQNKFEQKISCIGKQTANLLSKMGYFSVTTYTDMEDLKENFDWTTTKKLTYYCAKNNKKIVQDEKGKLDITFVEVFQVKLLRPSIDNIDFDYVLYFSPIGARSILSQNPELKRAKSICSGPSTHTVLQQFGAKNCFLVENPRLKTMIDFILENEKIA